MKFRFSTVLILTFIGVMAMSSCVKKYTCQCVIKYTGAPGLPDSTLEEYDIQDTKSGAESKCKAESYTHDNNGIKTIETCKLY